MPSPPLRRLFLPFSLFMPPPLSRPSPTDPPLSQPSSRPFSVFSQQITLTFYKLTRAIPSGLYSSQSTVRTFSPSRLLDSSSVHVRTLPRGCIRVPGRQTNRLHAFCGRTCLSPLLLLHRPSRSLWLVTPLSLPSLFAGKPTTIVLVIVPVYHLGPLLCVCLISPRSAFFSPSRPDPFLRPCLSLPLSFSLYRTGITLGPGVDGSICSPDGGRHDRKGYVVLNGVAITQVVTLPTSNRIRERANAHFNSNEFWLCMVIKYFQTFKSAELIPLSNIKCRYLP